MVIWGKHTYNIIIQKLKAHNEFKHMNGKISLNTSVEGIRLSIPLLFNIVVHNSILLPKARDWPM